jgi:hypothetical protein
MDDSIVRKFKSHWLPLKGGRLTLCARPGHTLLADLHRLGCTRVVTLLSEREGALSIGHKVQNRPAFSRATSSGRSGRSARGKSLAQQPTPRQGVDGGYDN